MTYKIGIIEDDKECSETLAECVRKEGWEPIKFKDIREFKARTKEVDVVMADMVRGEGNTIKAMDIIRAMAEGPRGLMFLTFVSLPSPTGDKSPEYVKSLFESGDSTTGLVHSLKSHIYKCLREEEEK